MLPRRRFDRGRLVLPAVILGGSLLIGGGILVLWAVWSWSLATLGQWVVNFCQLTLLLAAQ